MTFHRRTAMAVATCLVSILLGACSSDPADSPDPDVDTVESELPSSEVETTYFNNASFSQEVGWRILLCGGGTIKSGSTSLYAKKYQSPCEGTGAPRCYTMIDGTWSGPHHC